MSGISDRAEQIAAAVIAHALGVTAVALGRASAMDYRLLWSDGRVGMLEVTLIAHADAIGWQNQVAEYGGKWPVAGRWELRLRTLAIQHRTTMNAAQQTVELCNAYDVDSPEELPAIERAREPAVATLEAFGHLRRVPWGAEGISVFPPARAEFVDATSEDFADLLERWIQLEHVAGHVGKTASGQESERHLFLVAVDDILPIRFFNDAFDVPTRFPAGYEGIDGLWIWSNFWHRVLGWNNGAWAWYDTPTGR